MYTKFIKILLLTFLALPVFAQEAQVRDFLQSGALPDEIKEQIGSVDSSEDDDEFDPNEPTLGAASLFEESNRFGFNYIRTIPTSITATSDLPVPSDYIISFKDKIRVVMTGSRTGSYTVQVGLDGYGLLPNVGKFIAVGKEFEEVSNEIQRLVNSKYDGVVVDISISNLSAKKVNIIGAVKGPGTYLINPFSSISSSLAFSGGLQEYASLREIILIKPNGDRYAFDLYEFLLTGDKSGDLNIQNGDTIFVSSTTNYVEISGGILRPMVYEYKENETINDVIGYALGFKSNANEKKIAVKYYQKDTDEVIIKEVNLKEDFKLTDFKEIISLQIFEKDNNDSLNIRVTGPLTNTGYFSSDKYSNLNELVEDLNFTDKLNPYIGVVQRNNYSELFSLIDKETLNLELEENSEIIFFDSQKSVYDNEDLSDSSRNLLRKFQLKIIFKNSEIIFPIFGEFKLSRILEFLALDLSDIVLDKTSFISPHEDKVVVGHPDELVQKAVKSNSVILRAKDTEVIKVNIDGAVSLPGEYTLKSNSTLADLYMVAGGYRDEADSNAVVFLRKSARNEQLNALRVAKQQLNEFIITSSTNSNVSVAPSLLNLYDNDVDESLLGRISGDFSEGSEIAENMMLENGDVIIIPKRLITVSVFGEVLNAGTIIYDKDLKLTDYISSSGGFKESALKNGVYVIRSNGTIKKVRRGLFGLAINNTKIYPGDSIIIPRDIVVREDWTNILVPITSILSNLAFATASINTLNNN